MTTSERERLLAAYDRAVIDGQNVEKNLHAELQELRVQLDAARQRADKFESMMSTFVQGYGFAFDDEVDRAVAEMKRVLKEGK